MAQVSLNTRISIETAAALDKYAAETGKSKASIVEEALKEYIENGSKSNKTPHTST